MPARSGSADLPLHGGQVPRWLADRMTRLGAVISQAIVHHYGRDELLRRLAHPFWFQSFGAVMGMDWHSSGITTSVIGALKRGLDAAARRAWHPRLRRARQAFAANPAGAGRDRGSRRVRWSSAGAGEPAGRQGRQRRRAGRLRSLPARLHRHRRRPLGGGAAGHERRAASRRGAITGCRKGLQSFVDEPHAAIDGPGQGEIVNLTDRRAATSRDRRSSSCSRSLGPGRDRARARRRSKRAAAAPADRRKPLLPHLVMPAHHDVRAERRRRAAPARHSGGGGRSRPGGLRRSAADAGRGRAHGAGAGHGGRGGARRALPLRRSGAVLAGAWRQGRPSVPGAAQGLRRDDRGAEVGRAAKRSSAATRGSRAQAARRAGAPAGAPRRRAVRAGADRATERERSQLMAAASVFGWRAAAGEAR